MPGYSVRRGLPKEFFTVDQNARFLGDPLFRAFQDADDAPVCAARTGPTHFDTDGVSYEVSLAATPYSGPLRLGTDRPESSLQGTAHGLVQLKLIVSKSGLVRSLEIGSDNTAGMFTTDEPEPVSPAPPGAARD